MNTTSKALASLLAISVLQSAYAAAQVAAVVPPPPSVPELTGPDGLDHFQCYRVMPGPVAHAPISIITKDQFGKQQISIGQPILICNPTAKEHKGKIFEARNPAAHLICYAIVAQPPHPNRAIKTQNQFYARNYLAGQRNMFCAPSYKKQLNAAGVPID